jgi:predicted Fe-Mo cluster-binding NifX family protein
MKDASIKPIVTEITNIDEAVKEYIEGKLIDRTERID